MFKWSNFEEKFLMDIINSGDKGAIKCVMVDIYSKFVEFLVDPPRVGQCYIH